MSKKQTGLTKRGEYWHINKIVKGHRLYESTGTSNLEEAERYLNRRIYELREEFVHGEKRQRTFIEAATKYLKEETKKSLERDAVTLKAVMQYIGDLPLEQVYMDTLKPFINDRKKAGISDGTINRDLAVIRRVLVLASRLWRDDKGRPWLNQAPLLQMLADKKKRKPYPISWDEQARLLAELPRHLADMVLFAVNTGCREKEITGLKWSDAFMAHVFVLPEDRTKNGEERIIPLNSIAQSIIDSQRGKNTDYVFTYKGEPIQRINGTAWRKARERAGLKCCRVHDLRHTFGRRLRATDVSFEDRQDLLGHKSNRITTHYSRAEISNLVAAVERLCESDPRKIRVVNLTA